MKLSQLLMMTGQQFDKKDWRARIRPKKGGEDWAYGLTTDGKR